MTLSDSENAQFRSTSLGDMKRRFIKHRVTILYASIVLCLATYAIFRQDIDVWFNPVTEQTVVSNNLPLQQIWSFTSLKPFKGQPIGNNQITLLRIDESTIKAFETQTGHELWEYDAPNAISYGPHLFVTDSRVVGASGNGSESFLFTLNNLTGKEIWRVILPAQLTRTPDVIVLENTIVVAQRSARVFVAGYDLVNGQLLWEISNSVPATGYSGALACPLIPPHLDVELCLVFHEQVFVVDSLSGEILERHVSPFSLHRDVVYSRGKFFASTNRNKVAVQVFDVEQDRSFSLPASCTRGRFAYPITVNSSIVYVATGCSEAYTLPIADLQTSPAWIYTSPTPIASSFTTLDNSLAFLLDNRGWVHGLDTRTGEVVGRIEIEPSQEMNNRANVNGLYANAPYLYVVLDEGNLFVFEQLK